MKHFYKKDLNRIRRLPKLGAYDKEIVYKILDAAFVCNVGFVAEGQPIVIPTSYCRDNDAIYLHGASKSRMLTTLQSENQVCISVTLVDGIVMARSAFDHSMNYRSVVIFGNVKVVEEAAKEEALYKMSEHIIPGRWAEVRKPNSKELKATTILKVSINSASAKVRKGPPVDSKKDCELPIWAGVLPIVTKFEKQIPDPKLSSDITEPNSLSMYNYDRFLEPK